MVTAGCCKLLGNNSKISHKLYSPLTKMATNPWYQMTNAIHTVVVEITCTCMPLRVAKIKTHKSKLTNHWAWR